MAYSGNLIQLNGTTYTCILNYKVTRQKLWGEDTGRNMAGTMEGTLIGNFPTLALEIEPTEDTEMAELENILDTSSIDVIYWNNKYNCFCEGDFYSGDYDEELMKDRRGYNQFAVNLIAIESEENHVKLDTTI